MSTFRLKTTKTTSFTVHSQTKYNIINKSTRYFLFIIRNNQFLKY